MTTENVKSADRKPEVYTDSNGKKRVRMVAVDREIVKKESKVNEISTNTLRKYVDKAGPKADAGDKKRQDGESRAAKKITKSSDVKIHSTENTETDEACWDSHKQVGMKKKGGKMVPNCVPKEETTQEEGYIGGKGEKGRDKGNAGKFDKNTAYSHAKTHNGVVHKDTSGSYLVKHGRGKNVSEEPVDELSTKTLQSFADKSWKNPKRAQGVKTAAGKIVKKALEKESTYTAKVPKKHDSSKDISVADYKKKTGKKTVSLKHLTKNTHVNPFTEESVDEVWRKTPTPIGGKGSSAKYKEAEAEYDREKSFARKMKQRKAQQQTPTRKETAMESFKSVVSELTDKERARAAASKAKRLGKKAAVASKRQAEKDRPKRAKAGEDDHVIMQLRKAQDVGGNAEIRFHKGKSGKSNAKDIGHALKFHDTLKKPEDKRKLRIQLAKGGPAAVTKYANLYRKVTKTS